MGIREALNNNQKLTTVLAGVVVAALVGYIAYYVYSMGPRPASAGRAYFTVDEGKTLLVDDAARRAPFDHEGQQAVKVYLYECDGERFAGFLERYSPEAMQAFADLEAEAATLKPGGPPPASLGRAQAMSRGGLQVKRPGDADWVSAAGGKGEAVKKVTCPHGNNSTPRVVLP